MPDRTQRVKRGDNRQIEFRAMPKVEVRADSDTPGFEGYASVWWVVDSYGTAFAPGAFTKTLKERKPKIPHLWQHLTDVPIGRHRDIAEDGTGLAVDVELIDDGAEGSVAIKRLRGGIPLGLSHGFRTIRERPATDGDPLILPDDVPEWVKSNLPESVYVIEEVKLYETSTVSFPANEAAEIAAVRSDDTMQLLSILLDDVRAGRLTDTQRALVADLVAAWQAQPDAQPSAPPPDTKARLDAASLFEFIRVQAELAITA